MHSTEKKALALNLLLSLLMAAGYMLLFAYNNTPLGAAIGSDNAMYLTMGTALAKGWAPYVDVFDHKGPLLFALQGLPQWIGGGYNLTAVFLQEVVALFACLTVVRALARALSCPPVWAQLVYLAMTCAFMDGGNLTEEYTNLPTLLALYMALHVFGQEKIGEKLFLPAAGMGVCAAAAFSLRANNALPIFALVAVLAAGLAITQRFAQLGQCAAGFTLGLLAVFLPILIWLAAKGALSAAWAQESRQSETHVSDALHRCGVYLKKLNRIALSPDPGSITVSNHGDAPVFVCIVDSALYPETAEHIRVAQDIGFPDILTLDRGGAAERRKASLAPIKASRIWDRDEYPCACFKEGGAGAHVMYVAGTDNRGAGSYMGWQMRGLPDGTKVRVRVI